MNKEIQLLRLKLNPNNFEQPNNVDYQAKTEFYNNQLGNIINQQSSNKEKVDLFLSLFRGRSDVCAKRWKNKPGYSPFCHNDFKPGICYKPKVKCTECKNSNFAP